MQILITMRVLISIVLISIFSSAFAQEESLIIEGRIEEGTVKAIVDKNVRDMFYSLEDVEVTVLSGDLLVKTARTDTSGKYRITLVPNQEYSISFHKEGYLDKTFILDGTKYNLDMNRANLIESDVALFRDLNDEELRQYVQHPSAKCKFYQNRKEFKWDLMYAESQQQHFLKLLEKATIASLAEE